MFDIVLTIYSHRAIVGRPRTGFSGMMVGMNNKDSYVGYELQSRQRFQTVNHSHSQ